MSNTTKIDNLRLCPGNAIKAGSAEYKSEQHFFVSSEGYETLVIKAFQSFGKNQDLLNSWLIESFFLKDVKDSRQGTFSSHTRYENSKKILKMEKSIQEMFFNTFPIKEELESIAKNSRWHTKLAELNGQMNVQRKEIKNIIQKCNIIL